MSLDLICPSCQQAIPENAPGGICPACVMKLGKENPTRHTTFWSKQPTFSMDEVASHFPNLEFVEEIGQGGMGTVFKARQRSLDRLIAVKILSPRISNDPSFAERFGREARTLAKLSHPNVVAVYESGEVADRYFILMEYIDGINLRDAIRNKTLSPQDALAIVPQICEALFYAHEEGVVHRDIKPENILLDKKGRVKIADFGLAKLLGESMEHLTLTGTNQIVGTLNYMAPEQLEKPLAVDHRADIYSLGVVFYELLTGELPIGRFSAPSEFTGCDEKLDNVVFRTLEKEPDRRFQNASEVKNAVEGYEPRFSEPVPPRKADPLRKPANGHGDFTSQKPNAKLNHRIPFTIPNIHGGFAIAHGILRFDGKKIEIESQARDSIFGTFKSGTHQLEIPLDDVLWIRTRTRSGKQIVIQTDKLSTTEKLPGVESGCIKLNVAKADREMSLFFVHEVQQFLPNPSDVTDPLVLKEPRGPFTEDEARKRIFIPSMGLLTSGGINYLCAITVAVLFIVMWIQGESFLFFDQPGDSKESRDVSVNVSKEGFSKEAEPPTVVISIVAVFVIGTFGVGVPLLLGSLMLLGGNRMMHLKNHGFSNFVAIISMLPIHYGFVLGLPFGIWTLATLNNRSMRLTFEEIRALEEPLEDQRVPGKQK